MQITRSEYDAKEEKIERLEKRVEQLDSDLGKKANKVEVLCVVLFLVLPFCILAGSINYQVVKRSDVKQQEKDREEARVNNLLLRREIEKLKYGEATSIY